MLEAPFAGQRYCIDKWADPRAALFAVTVSTCGQICEIEPLGALITSPVLAVTNPAPLIT